MTAKIRVIKKTDDAELLDCADFLESRAELRAWVVSWLIENYEQNQYPENYDFDPLYDKLGMTADERRAAGDYEGAAALEG